jgi:hypothetical protein
MDAAVVKSIGEDILVVVERRVIRQGGGRMVVFRRR